MGYVAAIGMLANITIMTKKLKGRNCAVTPPNPTLKRMQNNFANVKGRGHYIA